MVSNERLPHAQDLALPELTAWLADRGEPSYRARQIWEWLHVRGAASAAEMTNLPAKLRQQITDSFDLNPLSVATRHASSDGSIKFVYRTRGQNPVEAVWMPGGAGGVAACLSSHSGCGLGCTFCQTGYLGQLESLSTGQILSQLYIAERAAGVQADRIVMMGMGEPLMNLGAVRQVVDTMCSSQGRGWSPRRITVSTVGLVKPIRKMADSFPRVNLALSLHFTTAEHRKRYMPRAEPELDRLVNAVADFRYRNGGKLTLEYMVLAGVNCSEGDARRLSGIVREITDGADSHAQQRNEPIVINLLPFNPIPSAPALRPTPERQLNRFAQQLVDLGLTVTVRRSRGRDIGAACGQLGTALH